MKINKALIAQILVLFGLCIQTSWAQMTEFTYQGKLNDGSAPANASYDFHFRLFPTEGGGAVIGTQARPGVAVSNGIFAVRLDFGTNFDGTPRWLEIGVKPAGSPNPFTILTPRQPFTSAPYSVRSLNATTADMATNSAQLGGAAASQYVITTDPRMADDRDPLPGSASYIQNTGIAQASSNFNISGTGAADIFNGRTQFNIGTARVLAIPGILNTFVGQDAGLNNAGQQNTFLGSGAGQQNTSGVINTFAGTQAGRENLTGNQNSFFGSLAGAANSTGGTNSFFGHAAGGLNTAGSSNSFFGQRAGVASLGSNNSFLGREAGVATTTGSSNAFFGQSSGTNNVTGSGNTLVGTNSQVAAPDLQFATAIGANASVSASNTIVLGRSAGQDSVQIPGALSIAGTFGANIVNAATQFNLGGARVFHIPGFANTFAGMNAGQTATGSNNSFFGSGAGQAAGNAGNSNSFFGARAGDQNTTGSENAFFGLSAGQSNTTGSRNVFVGYQAGFATTSTGSNSFFGYRAGANNAGSDNAFFGTDAGSGNTGGIENSFFGRAAGTASASGSGNSYFGHRTGAFSTGSDNAYFGTRSGEAVSSGVQNSFFGSEAGNSTTSGSNDTFIGRLAGSANTSGTFNVFVGTFAGNTNTTGDNNTIVGHNADVGAANLSFATAIGADAVVTTSNTVMLGRSADDVRVPGNLVIGTLGLAGSTDLCRNAGNQLATCSSSLRYKSDVRPFSGGLTIVRHLRPIAFDWIGGGRDIGFGAEEVNAVEPLLSTYNDKGEIEGVKYKQIAAVLVNAVKEQQAQIDELKRDIRTQEMVIDTLKKVLCKNDPSSGVCANR